jgi:hypothetical protein
MLLLSLTVVAQGVETKEQTEHLRLQACDELKGFYFKRPLPVDEFTQLLRDQATEITYIGKQRGVLVPLLKAKLPRARAAVVSLLRAIRDTCV